MNAPTLDFAGAGQADAHVLLQSGRVAIVVGGLAMAATSAFGPDVTARIARAGCHGLESARGL